ncbi:MAG TPA: glycerol-3-phosphate 1-O-acyltransferase PlsY [Opitutaceae bacterium]|nr:glycerol-3-phosphate 1-O-acyltransferase PlsY [Opitutaceae bacterium]
MFTPYLIAAILGYFLGAIPFGFLVARARGVNIFEVGSKSPGATNVKRVLGPGPGNLVFALDALKGAVAGGWPLAAFALGGMTDWLLANEVAVTGLVGALLGHSFSCFTRFKGGKGVATGAGGFLVLLPVPTLIGATVWVVTFYASHYVSLASILAAVAVPAAAVSLHHPAIVNIIAVAACVFVVVRHRTNIARLCKGTENKFSKKPEQVK